MIRHLIGHALWLFVWNSQASTNVSEETFVTEPNKIGIELLPYLKDYHPGPAALIGDTLYFANCSQPDVCESVHRISPKDSKIEQLAHDLVIRDLYEYSGKLVIERVVPTVEKPVAGEGGIQVEILREDGTFGLLWADQIKRAEATARFALHSLVNENPALDRKLYSRAFSRRSLVQTPEAAEKGLMLFQVLTAGGPLVLGQFSPEKEADVATQVIAPEQLGLTLSQVQALSPNVALALAPAETISANEIQSVLARFDLKAGTVLPLGRNSFAADPTADRVEIAQWAARKVSRVSATPLGGALLADQTSEPGERRSLWYLPAEGTEMLRVLGIPSADIRFAKLTSEGLLVSHGLGRSIVLYRSQDQKESTALSDLRASLKKVAVSSLERGVGCGRYFLLPQGDGWNEIIFRRDTPSGIQDYVSLGRFKSRADMKSPVKCLPGEAVAFLANEGALNLAADHLSLQLEWGERRRSNYKPLQAISEKKGDFRTAGAAGRLTSNEATFKTETPLLLVLKGSTLSLAREALVGSVFHELVQSKEPAGAKTVRLVSTDGQPLTEYELLLMPDGTEVFATDYSQPEADK